MKQIKVGEVISTKMDKTAVVRISYKVKHRLYKKIINKSKKFKARDEVGVIKGQTVVIEETKPFSKNVYYKVKEVLKK